ncbi:MAG: tryptophan synthase subunit alpha [Halioglobus sp.]|nr:tryptophan synthase subunit alpha [Halioglobus sp.]
MSRIATRLRELAQEGRKALIPYVVAGDPRPDVTVGLLHALVEAGADIVELGVPFSDPMSEGPVIQRGHERALANGMSLSRRTGYGPGISRAATLTTPLVLMGYANPVEHMGHAAFADAAAGAGVDGSLIVDIPPEEVEALGSELRRAGMDNIFLVAPTTPEARVAGIAARASGFIYYVALKGVTGAGNLDTDDVASHVATIRRHSDLPIAVGFGIKDAASAARVAAIADGVVVGSALVDLLAQSDGEERDIPAACEAAAELLRAIRRGIDAG